MFSIMRNRLLSSAAILASGLFLLTGPVLAQQVAANDAFSGDLETVVVTGTAFNADTAPAKARLETTEPQTIINQSYVQDSVAATADYTTILAIAPSMTGISLNGPGLSDGGVKNTLRGIPDGNFGINYDGIPFGDSNGPTHHSESYFPSTTIGSIDVDRGPGNAGNMGPSTFGGSINLFSENLSEDSHARLAATGGSFGTTDFNANYQTGDMDVGGHNVRTLLNFQDTNSAGFLTLQSTAHQNFLLKTTIQLAPDWTLTAFGNYNGLFQNLEDNAGETAAQINVYGRRFALQSYNPNAGNYASYNHIHKKTDMDYLRLKGDLGDGLSIDNTAYTYAYVNKGVSTTSVAQTGADITAGITEGNGSIVNGVAFKNDVPGYTKQNAYRMWGDIFRAAKDFDFGWLTGQLRAGVWWESSTSQRLRQDFDATKCFGSGYCNPWHDNTFADSRLLAKKKSAAFNGGFYEYFEHSSWSQYQPYVELELHPLDGLTVTPGFKYVNWTHNVNAPLEQKTVPVVPVMQSFTTTRDLPFLTANYKITPNWSVYAQYAQGIYVPDISSFEQAVPSLTFPKAQTSTNYQVGTVYYADNFTFDADVYYIGVKNNISFQACNLAPIFGPSGFTCAINTGTATYKGVEGEGTYAFDGDLDGFAVFLNASVISGKSNGKWLKSVPNWTAASGITYKNGDFKLSLIDKVVGQQYSDNADTRFYKLGAYNNMDFKGSMALTDNLDLSVGVYNVLNTQSLVQAGIVDSAPIGGANVYDVSNRYGSLDQYSFQPSRNYQVTLKASF
jgi:iron complex outermembrane receptor protein